MARVTQVALTELEHTVVGVMRSQILTPFIGFPKYLS